MTQRRAIPRGSLTVSSVQPVSRLRRSLRWIRHIAACLAALAAVGAVGAVLTSAEPATLPLATVPPATGALPGSPAPRVVFDETTPSAKVAARTQAEQINAISRAAPHGSASVAASRDPSGLRRSLLAMDRRSAQERIQRLLAEAGDDGLERARLQRVAREIGLKAAPRPRRVHPASTAHAASPEDALSDLDLSMVARSAAAWQLAAQDELGLEALLQATASRDASTRQLAAQALSRRADDPRAQNVLVSLQQDPEAMVRNAANKALARSTPGQRRSRRRHRRAAARQG